MELTRTTGAWVLMAALVLGSLGLLPSQQVGAQTAPDLNNPAYWETQTVHGSQCFKHEGDDLLSNVHGTVTEDGLAVILNPFNPNWFGDHWELLVVKAGTENFMFDHPSAGVSYPTSGQEVSHWIVCKGDGTTTTTETTTSSTQPTSTTTTTESTTTTETTVPSSTTSTTDPTTTTTAPISSTMSPSTTTPSTVPPSSPSAPPTTLPFTGIDDLGLYAGYAIALLSAGGLLILAVKRR